MAMSNRSDMAVYEHPSGPVAERYAARIRELEEPTLSPLAVRSYPAVRAIPGARLRAADAVSARP